MEDVVVPKLRSEMPVIRKQAIQSMQNDKFRGNEDEARMELGKRAKTLVRRETFDSRMCVE